MQKTIRRLAVVQGDDTSKIAVGERLRLTREALDLSQVDFCKAANIETNTYNQYEKGKNLPRLDLAIKIVRRFKLTLDWIYLGDQSNIPSHLADKIKGLRREGR